MCFVVLCTFLRFLTCCLGAESLRLSGTGKTTSGIFGIDKSEIGILIETKISFAG